MFLVMICGVCCTENQGQPYDTGDFGPVGVVTIKLKVVEKGTVPNIVMHLFLRSGPFGQRG